jgi:hypothetical protein
MSIHLVCQLYRPAEEQKWRQLLDVLRLNLARPEITSATVFLERCEVPWHAPQVQWQSTQRRLSFGNAIALMSHEETECIPKNLLVLNSDIVLDSSLERAAAALQRKNQVFCCTRREANGSLTKSTEPMRSQDAWLMAWHRPSAQLVEQLKGITLGRPGCENVLSAILWAHGYQLSNPCLEWRVHHADRSPKQYEPGGERYWGLYAYVLPCRLSDTRKEHLLVQFQHAQAPGDYQWIDL